MNRLSFLLLSSIALLACGCRGTPTNPSNDPIAVIRVGDETFRIRLDDAALQAAARAALLGGSASIPNGRIVPGTDVNAGWSWHLTDVAFAEVTIELCDGRPSMVEEAVRAGAEFGGGRFCPWSARVVAIEQPMPFVPGADVVVVAINRRGRVIDVRGGVYRVLVGALPMICREHELRAADTAQTARRPKRTRGEQPGAAVSPDPPDSTRPGVTRSIDLHGMPVEEARTAVVDFLSRAVMDGADTLEIIHGIGTGRVRDAVRRTLVTIGAVKQVRQHPSNPGITIVHL